MEHFCSCIPFCNNYEPDQNNEDRLGYLETIKLWHKNELIGLLLNTRRSGNV